MNLSYNALKSIDKNPSDDLIEPRFLVEKCYFKKNFLKLVLGDGISSTKAIFIGEDSHGLLEMPLNNPPLVKLEKYFVDKTFNKLKIMVIKFSIMQISSNDYSLLAIDQNKLNQNVEQNDLRRPILKENQISINKKIQYQEIEPICFTPIANIDVNYIGKIVNICGLIFNIRLIKSNRPFTKLILTDQSNKKIEINLWEDFPENFSKNSLICAINVRISNYNNTVQGNSIENLTKFQKTLQNNNYFDNLQSWSTEISPLPEPFKTSQEVHQLPLATKELEEIFFFRGRLENIEIFPNKIFSYQSCINNSCKTRVFHDIYGQYQCHKCGNLSENCVIRYRTVLLLSDDYGDFKATAFDNVMTFLLGMNCSSFKSLLNSSNSSAESLIKNLCSQPILASIKLSCPVMPNCQNLVVKSIKFL